MINSTLDCTQVDSKTFEMKVRKIRDRIVEETTQKASHIMKKYLAKGQGPDQSRSLTDDAFVQFEKMVTREFPGESYKNTVYLAILSQQKFFCYTLRTQLCELMAPKVEVSSKLTEQAIDVEELTLDPEERERIRLELDNWIRNTEANGNTEEAARRILEAFDTSAEELILKKLGITFLPSEVIDLLPRLSRLDLSLNSLTDFSVKRDSLPNLELLDLSDNQIVALSPKLADLSNRCLVLTKNNPLSEQTNILEEKRSTLCLHINEIILKVVDAKSPLASSEIFKKDSQEEALNQDQSFQYLKGTEAKK